MPHEFKTLPAFEAVLHESLNEEYALRFKLPATFKIAKYDLINVYTPRSGEQLFRVASVETDGSEQSVYARHIFFDLSGNYSLGFTSSGVVPTTMVSRFVESLVEKNTGFSFATDIIGTTHSYNPDEDPALEVLMNGQRSLVGILGAELERDNYKVVLRHRIGVDTNEIIHPRKNIIDMKHEWTSDDICTKILLRGTKRTGDKSEPMSSTITSPLISKYPNVYVRKYENNDEEIDTVAKLEAWGRLKFSTDHIDVPNVEFSVDVENMNNIHLGDTALIKITELDVFARQKCTGYDYDPVARRYIRLYFGQTTASFTATVGDIAWNTLRPQLDAENQHINDRIEAFDKLIDDEIANRKAEMAAAIAKAEADVAEAQRILGDNLNDAVSDWNDAFVTEQGRVDTSIENVESILGNRITANTSSITQTKDTLAFVVAGATNASAVVLTENALTAIAKDIDLMGNVRFSSLVEGDDTRTEILGGKIKTHSIGAEKIVIGDMSNIIALTQGVSPADTGLTWVGQYWHSNFTVSSSSTVCTIVPMSSVQNFNWHGKDIKLRFTGDIFPGSSTPYVVEIHFYDSAGVWLKGAYSSAITPSATTISKATITVGKLPSNASKFFVRLRRDGSDTAVYGIRSMSLYEMNAGELLVDGSITANHIVSGSANIAEITSILLRADVLEVAWAKIGSAVITKLTVDDALIDKLTTKQAFINVLQSTYISADYISGGILASKNNALQWNLDNSFLKFTAASNAMEYSRNNHKAGIRFGEMWSSVLGLWTPTVGLYTEAPGGLAYTCGLEILSQEQQLNIRGDRISLYDYKGANGFHFKTGLGTPGLYPGAGNTLNVGWINSDGGYPSGEGYFAHIAGKYILYKDSIIQRSTVNAKHVLGVKDDVQSLNTIRNIPIREFFYKDDDLAEPSKRKIGAMIEDIRTEPDVANLLLNREDGFELLEFSNVPYLLWSATRELSRSLDEAYDLIWDLQQQLELISRGTTNG